MMDSDFEKLREAVLHRDRRQCVALFSLCKRTLPSSYQSQVFDPHIFKVDELAQQLLPDDLPNNLHFIPVETKGLGNCLYNAASIQICGNESLATSLRILNAAELYVNATEYGEHPVLVKGLDTIKDFHPTTVFTSAFSKAGEDMYNQTNNKTKAVEAEALAICQDGAWNPLVALFSLATVLETKINSVYPKLDHSANSGNILRPIFHSSILPLAGIAAKKCDISFLWSKQGALDNTPNAPFRPDHFVALLPTNIKIYKSYQSKSQTQTKEPRKKGTKEASKSKGTIMTYFKPQKMPKLTEDRKEKTDSELPKSIQSPTSTVVMEDKMKAMKHLPEEPKLEELPQIDNVKPPLQQSEILKPKQTANITGDTADEKAKTVESLPEVSQTLNLKV